MKTSPLHSSLLVSMLAALVACGGGGQGDNDALEDVEHAEAGYVTEHDRICQGLDHCSEECQQRLMAHDGKPRCCEVVR